MKKVRSLAALDRREFLSTAATATAMREPAAAVRRERALSVSLG